MQVPAAETARNLNAILLAFYTIFCPPLLQNSGVHFQFFPSCDLFLNMHFALTLTIYSGVPLWHKKKGNLPIGNQSIKMVTERESD